MENYQIADAINNRMTKQMLRQTTIIIDKLRKTGAKGTYLCSLVVGGKTVKVEKLVIE